MYRRESASSALPTFTREKCCAMHEWRLRRRSFAASKDASDGSSGPIFYRPSPVENASEDHTCSIGYGGSPPHPCCNILLFLADGIGVDRCGGELRMAHPFLDHVQGYSVNCGVDPEPVSKAFRRPVGGIGNACGDHDPFHDLPDAHAAQRPDGRCRLLSGALRFANTVGCVQGVEELCRHRNRSEDDFVFARGILSLLQAAEGDGSPREVDPGWGDLEELRRPTPCPVQSLAQGPVPRRLAPGRGEEGRPLFSIEIEPVSGGVIEAHFRHEKQNARILLNAEALMAPLPRGSGAVPDLLFNRITNSVKQSLSLGSARLFWLRNMIFRFMLKALVSIGASNGDLVRDL